MSDEIICECGHEADVHNGGCTWSGCDCGESASGLYNDAIAALREALQKIDTGCHNYTAGTTCWDNGRRVDAEHTAEKVCDACIAHAALAKKAG
jgi:hypothetical protein